MSKWTFVSIESLLQLKTQIWSESSGELSLTRCLILSIRGWGVGICDNDRWRYALGFEHSIYLSKDFKFVINIMSDSYSDSDS